MICAHATFLNKIIVKFFYSSYILIALRYEINVQKQMQLNFECNKFHGPPKVISAEDN